MEYSKIGIDIDNVLTELLPVIEDMALQFGKEVPDLNEIKDYNLSSVFGVEDEVTSSYWKEREGYLIRTSMLALERVNNIYDQFTNDDTEIHIITNRDEKYRGITEQWLYENDIYYHELHMTSGMTKIPLMNKLCLEAMVDDKPSLFHEAYEHKLMRSVTPISQIHMICVDYPYNKDVHCEYRLSSKDGDLIGGSFFESNDKGVAYSRV